MFHGLSKQAFPLVLGLALVVCAAPLALAAGDLPTAVYNTPGPHVVVNGELLATRPEVVNDHTLVPMRAVFEALQAEVNWSAANQQITATRGGTVVTMWIGRNAAVVNGHSVPLDAPPVLVGDEAYVPLRFPAESFGGDVRWNSVLQTATITIAPASAVSAAEAVTPAPAATPAPAVVIPPPVVVVPSTPAVVPTRSGTNGVYVELSRPQSDDEGHYVGVVSDEATTVIGTVAAVRGVTQVAVNGVPASLTPANSRLLAAPSRLPTLSFMAPTDLGLTSPLFVTVTDTRGEQTTITFVPDRTATLSRLAYLRDVARAAELRNELAAADYEWFEFRLANAYVVAGNYEVAYPLYRRFIEVEPSLAIGPFFLGIAFCEAREYDLALVEYRRVVVIEPRFYFVHYELGRCYEGYHRYPEAIEEYRHVMVDRPDCVAARWRLGVTLGFAGHHDEALVQLQTVVNSAPRFAAGHHLLGNELAAQEKWGAAQDEYRRAAGLDPRNAAIRAHLGDALSQQHEYGPAIQEYSRALQDDPQHQGARAGLVQTMMNAGQYDQAWGRVHEAQKVGVALPPQLLQQLRDKRPEPRTQMGPGQPGFGAGRGGPGGRGPGGGRPPR